MVVDRTARPGDSVPGARVVAQFERLRWIRAVSYLLICAGGVLGSFHPPNVLLDGAGRASATVCTVLWALGGAVAFLSLAKRSVWGEYLVLRPLALGMFAFSAALLVQVHEVGAPLIAYAAILASFGLSLWGWWYIVDALLVVGGKREGNDGPRSR